ncbi:MAG: hypothetical protein EXQ90_05220 [Rhodospirillales bacterium]|nr:hypothetical protein [Rhodospirillales bacterium]
MTTGAVALNANTTLNAGSGALTTGAVTGNGHDLTIQGSGTATMASASGVGTLAFAKTGGTASVTGNLSATGLTTAANNYGVALTGATTTVTNATVFTNTGAVVLGDGGDQLTFAGGLNTAAAGSTSIGGTVATTNTALNAGSSVVTTGALNAGAHDITIVVDGITLTGNWTGTGSWTLQPGTASTTVGLAGAAGQFSLDATELARLANATAAQVTVGRSDGTGAVTANGFSFDDALTLRGGPILLQGVLNKPAGALILSSTGAVVGTVNLAAETGVLKVGGVSAALTGTVDGLGDIAAASRTVLVGVPGTGPFTINGQSFQILAVPVPPVAPATQAAAVTAVVQVLAAVKSTAASPSGGSGAGSSDTGAASQALTGGSATSQPYAVQVSFDQFSLSAPSGVALADTSTAAGGDAPAQVNPMDEAVGDANDFLENFRGQ